MAYNFRTLRFTVPAISAIEVLQFDENRKYLLVACSPLSAFAIYIAFYSLTGSNQPSIKDDTLVIYPNGYYEPVLVPNNIISIHNPNTSPAIGFILTV